MGAKPHLTEAQEQTKLFNWAKAHQHIYPQLEFLFAIPNGGSRHPVEAKNLKAQGVKSGVPDLCLPFPKKPYHGLYIEMKVGKNKPKDNQKKWLEYLSSVGYLTDVCYSCEEAQGTILNYLRGVTNGKNF